MADDRAAGFNPIAVCANAGATSTGAIDPLPAVADYCAAEQLWLHVDATYGGFAAVTEPGKRLLRGLERTDSVGLDPHKWSFQPYEVGALLVKDARTLEHAFAVHPGCPAGHGVGRESPQRRRPRPATEPLVSRLEGVDVGPDLRMSAFRRAVAKGMELAHRAGEYVRESPMLEFLTPVSLGIVCFRINPAEADLDEAALEQINRTVLARIFWEDRAFLSSTLLHKTFARRLCIVNHSTTWDDVRETLQAAERFGREAATPAPA